jgi:glycosyltransferase involved in cell wall biosynthesis
MAEKKNVAFFGVTVIGKGIPTLVNILKGLSLRYNITVYSFNPVSEEEVPVGIRVRSTGRHHWRIQYFILMLRFLWDHVRSPYSLMHAQSALPAGLLVRALGKIFNLPWVLALIGGETEMMPHVPYGILLRQKLIPITKKICEDADILAVMSLYQATIAKGNLHMERSIEVLPYGPVTKATLADLKLSYPIRLLHVSYYQPFKNPDMLLQTMAILKKDLSCQLTIVGDNYDAAFKKKVIDLGLENIVSFAGFVPYNEVEKYFNAAHILIHTSWYEGLPLVAFEAMGWGLMVCGTKVGILSDFSGELCLTAEPGNSKELAAVILRISKDKKLYDEIRQKAHAWAVNNDLNFYVNRMSEFYESLINKKLKRVQ